MTNCKRSQLELWDIIGCEGKAHSKGTQVFVLTAGRTSELIFLVGLGDLARGPPRYCHSCSNCITPSRTRLGGAAGHLCEAVGPPWFCRTPYHFTFRTFHGNVWDGGWEGLWGGSECPPMYKYTTNLRGGCENFVSCCV